MLLLNSLALAKAHPKAGVVAHPSVTCRFTFGVYHLNGFIYQFSASQISGPISAWPLVYILAVVMIIFLPCVLTPSTLAMNYVVDSAEFGDRWTTMSFTVSVNSVRHPHFLANDRALARR
jgi:hypothetical protein